MHSALLCSMAPDICNIEVVAMAVREALCHAGIYTIEELAVVTRYMTCQHSEHEQTDTVESM